MPISEVTNEDCMIMMSRYPDKFFDLAVVDPPFGINGCKEIGVKKGQTTTKWGNKHWDNSIPDTNYFEELFRVSKNQIIWGGNYFGLPPTRCVLVWDKVQRIDMADCEIAWTSFETSARIFTYARSNIQGFRNPDRFHPTEKPKQLYTFCFNKYAKKGDRILDTHLGSQSSRIAAWPLDLDFWGTEIDEDYFKEGCGRFNDATFQLGHNSKTKQKYLNIC